MSSSFASPYSPSSSSSSSVAPVLQLPSNVSKVMYPSISLDDPPMKKRKIVSYIPDKQEIDVSEYKILQDTMLAGMEGSSADFSWDDEWMVKKMLLKGKNVSTARKIATTTTNTKKIPKRRKVTTLKMKANPVVSHTIELLRHKREIQHKIELIEEEGVVHRVENMPIFVGVEDRKALQHVPLKEEETKTVLQKRLIMLLAHGGYTHTSKQAVEVLSEVLDDVYSVLARRIKQISEMEMSGTEQEFPDPMERALVEKGFGGVRGLERYYRKGVLDFRSRVEEQCIYLRKLYAHKIRLKVGLVGSSSTGGTSSQPPGNSVLTEILCGLEGRMVPSSHSHNRGRSEQVKESHSGLKSNHHHPTLDKSQRLHMHSRVVEKSSGFLQLPPPGSHSSIPRTININKGILTDVDPKTKLKEALSQRNLLRLNFEPSSNDSPSTVLLSSSSPSAPTPKSNSIHQHRLKL